MTSNNATQLGRKPEIKYVILLHANVLFEQPRGEEGRGGLELGVRIPSFLQRCMIILAAAKSLEIYLLTCHVCAIRV